MNILRLKINWPKNMDRKTGDLISRILKYNPDERISLENMLRHPFFTQLFPNAISCLKRHDNNILNIKFTWNPIFTNIITNSYNINKNYYGTVRIQPQLYNPYQTQTFKGFSLDILLYNLVIKKKKYNLFLIL